MNGQTTRLSWDDEGRLTSQTFPHGHSDTFTYTGLGMRLRKNDPSGNYSYLCDGTSPASPVLSDGHAVYTPGLSENRGGSSAYYANDRLGNLWTLDGATGKSQVTYEDTTGFGSLTAGSRGATPFGFGGGNGCQTDADTGLVLMGHRYYDTRIGRFISQDPAGSGNNWYAYAGNNPVDKVDPSGLITKEEANQGQQNYNNDVPGLYDFYSVTNGDYANAKYLYTKSVGYDYISILGSTPSRFLNFPGGAGSSFLTRRMQYAQVEYKRARLDIPGRIKWLSARVGAGNPWDIKKDVLRARNPYLWFQRDSAGNFMYGAISTGAGFHTQAVLFGAGYAQWKDQGWVDSLSHALTHGDDPIGQADIAAGIDWANGGQPVFSLVAPTN